MAQSRLEKVGTIYTRLSSLIKSGALKEENKPFWLDLYKAFPPKYEPCFDRPASSAPVRQIFYAEDTIRAKFHKEHKHYSMVNLLDNKSESNTEQFIIIYRKLEREGVPETELYDKAVKEYFTKLKIDKPLKEAQSLETDSTSEPVQRQRNINIKKLLTEKENENGDIHAKTAKDATKPNDEDQQKYKPIKFSIDKVLQDKEDVKKSE